MTAPLFESVMSTGEKPMKRSLTNTQKIIILVIVILSVSGLFSGMKMFSLFGGRSGNGRAQTVAFKGGFSDIEIRSRISDVRFYRSGDRNGKVVWSGQKGMKLTVETKHGTLKITEKNKWPWFLRIGIGLKSSEMLVYLPDSSYKELDIRTDTARVSVPAEFSFADTEIGTDTGAVNYQADTADNLEIETDTGPINVSGISPDQLIVKSDTGSVTLNGIRTAKDLTAETDTGRITLTDVRCGDLDAESDTGSISLNDVIASGKMEISSDTGSVRLDRCDAASVDIRTDTGSIKGSLLSDKVFTAKSGTGRVSVPDTSSGGPCVLRSGTGSIEISVPLR